MAMHLYMSQDRILLNAWPPRPGDLYNYRGECGPGDDPKAFTRLMEARGYDVVIAATGEPGPITSPTGKLSTEHWRGIPRRNIEDSQ